MAGWAALSRPVGLAGLARWTGRGARHRRLPVGHAGRARTGRFDAFRAWVIDHLPNDRRVILVVWGIHLTGVRNLPPRAARRRSLQAGRMSALSRQAWEEQPWGFDS